MSGYFVVQRNLFDHVDFADEPFTEREAWLWLISEAAWKPKRVRFGSGSIELQRGELAHSLRFMAEKWKWSVKRVRGAIDRAEKQGRITRKRAHDGAVITICNYDKYQLSGHTEGQSEGTARAHEGHKEEEVKKVIQEKEIVAKKVRDARSPDFEKFWIAYPRTPVMSKKQAWAEWQKLPPDDQSAALAAVAPFKEWLAKQKDHPVVHACRFLSQRRFEGFKPSLGVVSSTVFVPGDSEAFAAWERHAGRKFPRDRNGGWRFESEYPPGHERAA
jgi:hypothetical protein